MVTQALTGAARVTSTVTAVIQALKAIDKARKDIKGLRDRGLTAAANALESDCNRAEKAIRSSLASAIRRRAKARTKARQQTRTTTGKFG